MLVCDCCWNDRLPQADDHFALSAIQGQALAWDWSSRRKDELHVAEYTFQDVLLGTCSVHVQLA